MASLHDSGTPRDRTERWLLAFVCALLIAVLVVTTARGTEGPTRNTYKPTLAYQHHTAEWWAHRTTLWKRRALNLRRVLHQSPSFLEAAELAGVVYGVSSATLVRKGLCESHGYARAENRSSHAKGAWQFLDSTWRSTPFRWFSPFSLYANALAAGWMHHVGRGGEWSCR